MEIKGKRILITCREDDSRPFYFLIKDWMKYNEVAAYFIKASESGFKKNPSNESTYYAFKKNISLKVYDVNSIAEIFIQIYKIHIIIIKNQEVILYERSQCYETIHCNTSVF